MKEVKEYYDNYNYPLIKLYTNKQTKKHIKLITKIVSFAQITPKQLSGKKVLDAGCGTGEKSIFFAKNGAKVTSIDISDGQLSVLKKRAKEERLDIKIFQKDILNEDLSSLGTFDYIFSIGVLHHTEDAKKGFKKLSLLLKDQGVIVIALYHKYARLRYRITRLFLHIFFSKDPKQLEKYFHSSFLLKPLKKAPKNSIYDR
jgi:2-polyprenyl-3-methyl-5-hydroxy-6-metoxy-1,4-benzoquinol methylase